MFRRDLIKQLPKHAIILYHKNVQKIYKKEWIEKCIRSLEAQTYKDFDVIELSYGIEKIFLEEIIERKINFKNHIHIHKPLNNHVDAMNFLLNYCFSSFISNIESNYEVVFNTNIDDYFSKDRLMEQIDYIANTGCDLVSSDFTYVEEDSNGLDVIKQSLTMSNRSISTELENDHNILCHPAVAYTRDFWLKHGPYPDSIPREDLLLWKKALTNGAKFGIVSKPLCFYRLHSQQITARERK